MSLAGTVKNGVIVLDNGHTLAEGTRVEVLVTEQSETTASRPTLRDRLRKLAGTVDDLPPDMTTTRASTRGRMSRRSAFRGLFPNSARRGVDCL